MVVYSEGGMRFEDIRIDLKPLSPVPTKILPFSLRVRIGKWTSAVPIKKHLPLVVAVNGR